MSNGCTRTKVLRTCRSWWHIREYPEYQHAVLLLFYRECCKSKPHFCISTDEGKFIGLAHSQRKMKSNCRSFSKKSTPTGRREGGHFLIFLSSENITANICSIKWIRVFYAKLALKAQLGWWQHHFVSTVTATGGVATAGSTSLLPFGLVFFFSTLVPKPVESVKYPPTTQNC